MTPSPPRVRRLPRPRYLAISGLVVVLVLALVAGVGAVWAVRRPFPTYDGQLTVPGLTAPVTVHRDRYGVPHVYAETVEDLFFAQGFVHAQDRFWEMDFRRHVTAGRTAELFGEDQVDTDAFLRTLGWRRVAEAEWDMVTPRTRRYLTAYADGVNAWIAHTGGPAATGGKSLHYRLLGLLRSGYEVEPWHPVDTLSWLKAMAWDLRTNVVAETDRALLLAAGLSPSRVEQLYPHYPFDRHAPIVPGGRVVDGEFVPDAGPGEGAPPPPVEALTVATDALSAVAEAAAAVPPLLGTAGDGLGSNSWVVAGDHTATGAPLLANDPHLGVSMPGIWYQMGLHCACGYRVSGFTFSGVPGVVIGHNDRIAWGFTNLGHDVADLYLERLDGDRYQVDGEWRDLQVHEETIRVAGGEDVTVRVRSTHHGPLLSDVSAQFGDLAGSADVAAHADARPGDTLGVSLAWTALRPGTTIEALFAINQAQGWDDFRAAAQLFEVPAQNLVYADVDGGIGYQAPGRVPVRGAGDGRWPAPGWDSAYDWQGFLDFDDLPWLRDPESGIIVTANQAVIGPQYQPFLARDWSYGYRSDRIADLLAEAVAAGPVDVADMTRLQVDDRNGFAATLVPALLAAPTAPLSRDERAARDLLAAWDFHQPADGEPGTAQARSSAAAAYFNAVWRHLLALLFDELPDDVRPNGGDRWFEVVTGLLGEPHALWWDRLGTRAVETRDDVLAQALAEAYREVAITLGDDPTGWRWGDLHTVTLRDATFGSSGIGFVEALVNRGPVPVGGGGDLVNATAWDAASGYDVTASPSMRMVVDLSDLDESRWIQTTGNSGHPYHPHYADQVELWRTGETIPWRWNRATIEQESVARLVLRP
ncbi:MAG TPA: penicillin acylase family protein [Natronosporangium sp.]|nr:penicillin acylase family protein [Natronosporangium sp.]